MYKQGRILKATNATWPRLRPLHNGPRFGPFFSQLNLLDDRVQVPGPKLYIVHNGQGSPCLDLRRVPDLLAEACSGTDLIIIEGMGRCVRCPLLAYLLAPQHSLPQAWLRMCMQSDVLRGLGTEHDLFACH